MRAYCVLRVGIRPDSASKWFGDAQGGRAARPRRSTRAPGEPRQRGVPTPRPRPHCSDHATRGAREWIRGVGTRRRRRHSTRVMRRVSSRQVHTRRRRRGGWREQDVGGVGGGLLPRGTHAPLRAVAGRRAGLPLGRTAMNMNMNSHPSHLDSISHSNEQTKTNRKKKTKTKRVRAVLCSAVGVSHPVLTRC